MRINNKVYKYMVKTCSTWIFEGIDQFKEDTEKVYFTDKESAVNTFNIVKQEFKDYDFKGSVTLYSSNYTVLDKFTKVN